MPTIDLGPLGAVLSPAEDGFAATAGELERIGYSTIWLTGGPMTSLSQVTDAVRATASATIATGIIPVDTFPRTTSPRSTASWRPTAPGRFVVGLGGAHGADPLTHAQRLPRPPRRRRAARPPGHGRPRPEDDAASPATGRPAPSRCSSRRTYVAPGRESSVPDTTLAVEQLVVLETDAASGAGRSLAVRSGSSARCRRTRRASGGWGSPTTTSPSLGDALVDGLVAWGDADSDRRPRRSAARRPAPTTSPSASCRRRPSPARRVARPSPRRS